MWKRK